MEFPRLAGVVACVVALSTGSTACGEPVETTGVGTESSAAVDTSSTPAFDHAATAPSAPPTDPFVSPPLPRTYIDDQGLRCLEYETSAANRAVSGVCFDDSHDELGIRTVGAGDHYPKATVIGGTDDIDAVRVIIAAGGGTEHEASLIVVEDWPERVFAADLPAGAVEVRLEAEDGRILSSTTA